MLFLRIFIVGVAAIATLNCSLDATQIMTHPKSGDPGQVITVELMTSFIRLEQDKTISENVVRDSIHIGIGLPNGEWSIQSVKAYAASHYRPLADLSPTELENLQNGTGVPQEFYDSLTTFKSREIHAPLNVNMDNFFSDREFDATTDNGPDITVVANDVHSWNGYSAPVNITMNQGDPVDIYLPDENAQPGSPDSIGYSLIPIFVTVELRTGTTPSNDNLYYYTKTGPLPPMPDPNTQEIDVGSMVYSPFNLGGASIHPLANRSSMNLTISKSGANHFTIKAPVNTASALPYELNIFDTRGNLIASPTDHFFAENKIQFNWAGGLTPPGLYVAKFSLGDKTLHKTFRITP